MHESWPMVMHNGNTYCGDCAFMESLITEKELLHDHYFFIGIDGLRATVHDGKVYVAVGKFPWEHTSNELRNTPEYKQWRAEVFERDNFTCVICRKVGGVLNAHHIKVFRGFESERFKVDNGVTLCEDCHRRVHKQKNPKWVITDGN